MKTYKSKNRARRAIDDDEQFFIDNVYCPLIKANCNPYCVCFQRPVIGAPTGDRTLWWVEGDVCCGNYMLKGD